MKENLPTINGFVYYVFRGIVTESYKEAVFTEVVIYAHIHIISNDVIAHDKGKC